MHQSIKPENINKSFFDGHYKEIWRHIFPEKTTMAEVDWIIQEGNLNSDSKLLDIMCGYGRHSLEFARKGISVSAVDTLCDYIDEIKGKANDEKLGIETICEDVLDMALEEQYDVVICMGNSLQFFNEEETLRLLANLSGHMKPGGKFFINTWSIAEIAMKNFKEKNWSRIDDLLFLTDSKIIFHPTRIETNSTIITDAGDREEKKGIDFIYSISEIEVMLNKSDFQLKEIYSIPGKKQFSVGEPRAYIVAEKSLRK